VHSFYDFNLQIPANAALFYVLCGLAAGSAYENGDNKAGRILVYERESLD
jgi:hypothetical protein